MKKILILSLIVILAFLVTTGFNLYASELSPDGIKTDVITTSFTDDDGVKVETSLKQVRFDTDPSTYVEVKHTVTNAHIYPNGNLIPNVLNYTTNGHDFNNRLFTIYFANSLSGGGGEYILDGSVSTRLHYTENTYRRYYHQYETFNWMWDDNFPKQLTSSVQRTTALNQTNTTQKNVRINQMDNGSGTEMTTGLVHEVDLNEMFVSNTRYYMTTVFSSYYQVNYTQLIVPRITGFEIKYTAKIDSHNLQTFAQGSNDYDQFNTSVGYYTTTQKRHLSIEPNLSVSCGTSFKPPFIGCSGPSLSISNAVTTITNHKVSLFNRFYYTRSLNYDQSISKITYNLMNVKYGSSNTTTGLPNEIKRYFLYEYTAPPSGGGGCEPTYYQYQHISFQIC